MDKPEEPIYNDWVGRKVTLWLASNRRPYIVRVMEVGTNGKATKFKATRRQESLGKRGFIKEGDEWVIVEHQVCRN